MSTLSVWGLFFFSLVVEDVCVLKAFVHNLHVMFYRLSTPMRKTCRTAKSDGVDFSWNQNIHHSKSPIRESFSSKSIKKNANKTAAGHHLHSATSLNHNSFHVQSQHLSHFISFDVYHIRCCWIIFFRVFSLSLDQKLKWIFVAMRAARWHLDWISRFYRLYVWSVQ